MGLGLGTWVTFVVAAACMSVFKRRDEHAIQLQQWIASDSTVQLSICFKAWWPCVLASLTLLLLLTQASRHGLIAKQYSRKAIHMSKQLQHPTTSIRSTSHIAHCKMLLQCTLYMRTLDRAQWPSPDTARPTCLIAWSASANDYSLV